MRKYLIPFLRNSKRYLELPTRKSLKRESDSHSMMMISWQIDVGLLGGPLGNTKRYFVFTDGTQTDVKK